MRVKLFSEESVFILLFTIFTGVIIYASFQLRHIDIAKVPLIIGIPAFVGLLWQLARVCIPKWNDYLTTKFKKSSVKQESFDMDDSEEETKPELRKRVIFSLWLVLFLIVTYFLGFMYSIPILLIFYFRFMEKIPWVKTIIATFGYTLFMYLFFSLLLGVI